MQILELLKGIDIANDYSRTLLTKINEEINKQDLQEKFREKN